MLITKNDLISASITPNFSDDSIQISAGSVIFDNTWINYNSSIFVVTDYINRVVVGSRTRFFKNRNYALNLIIGLDVNEGITAVESSHVPFTSISAIPFPQNFTIIPLVCLTLIQDGSTDLVTGYIPLKQDYIRLFSGAGNILDKNIQGPTGIDCDVVGSTGLMGDTGAQGYQNVTGIIGLTGFNGITPAAPMGITGLSGLTGVSWTIDIPFVQFF